MSAHVSGECTLGKYGEVSFILTVEKFHSIPPSIEWMFYLNASNASKNVALLNPFFPLAVHLRVPRLSAHNRPT